MNIIKKLLERKEFEENPPVLLDVGASGELNQKWKKIAKYSICIAFDADDRELDFIQKESKHYKKLYIVNRVLTDTKDKRSVFYLTNSPFCSSRLMPDSKNLKDWAFHHLFDIKKKVTLKSIDIKSVIKEIGLSNMDWFKTDSQGTDLRLFKSMGSKIINKTLVAEFEPGFIDAYKGEDKFYHVLQYMNDKNFWISDIKIIGSQRIRGKYGRNPNFYLKSSPGWVEVTYLNDFKKSQTLDKREFFLAYVFALIERQYGFALEISRLGLKKYKDPIFIKMKKYASQKINLNNNLILRIVGYIRRRVSELEEHMKNG